MNVYLIEGLDRLGKTTLINGIRDARGFYQVIHYAKPELLQKYKQDAKKWHLDEPTDANISKTSLYQYQYDSFLTMFGMIAAGKSAKIIFDRAHLGEMVYAPLYRNYSGSYVYDFERAHDVKHMQHAKLILLTEDFSKSGHFADDGNSLGPASARAKEQDMFKYAFGISAFRNKQMINVTADDGSFRPAKDILKEALAD